MAAFFILVLVKKLPLIKISSGFFSVFLRIYFLILANIVPSTPVQTFGTVSSDN